MSHKKKKIICLFYSNLQASTKEDYIDDLKNRNGHILVYVTDDYSTTQLSFNQWLKIVEFVAMKYLSTKTERGREKKISKMRINFEGNLG